MASAGDPVRSGLVTSLARPGGNVTGFTVLGPELEGKRLATYVDRILKGAKPAEPPVQEPPKFELVINLRTANALGVTLPPSLVGLADEVLP